MICAKIDVYKTLFGRFLKIISLPFSINNLVKGEVLKDYPNLEGKEYEEKFYSYMHDIFGADVIDIFDMKYNPEENKLH